MDAVGWKGVNTVPMYEILKTYTFKILNIFIFIHCFFFFVQEFSFILLYVDILFSQYMLKRIYLL